MPAVGSGKVKNGIMTFISADGKGFSKRVSSVEKVATAKAIDYNEYPIKPVVPAYVHNRIRNEIKNSQKLVAPSKPKKEKKKKASVTYIYIGKPSVKQRILDWFFPGE